MTQEKHPELLHAVRIHLGLLGVLVNVTIRIQPLRIMTCNKVTIDVADFKASFLELQENNGMSFGSLIDSIV